MLREESSGFPVRFPEIPLEELPELVAREGLAKLHGRNALVGGQLRVRPLTQFGGLDCSTRPEHHQCEWGLSPLSCGTPITATSLTAGCVEIISSMSIG